ncbi:MAG: hypothetical protein OXT67_02735 [Zetaproteobacteria bacterium]|nr:hypothetical protein [Zetaproteobacteria bacterium]
MIPETIKSKWKLNESNYDSHYLRFQERQAGVSLVFDPDKELYYYNAYCIEMKLLKELFTVEYTFLEEALETIDAEFGTWELTPYDKKKSGCGSCAAKN